LPPPQLRAGTHCVFAQRRYASLFYFWMIETGELVEMVERALLIGAYTDNEQKAEADSLLAELEELVNARGVPSAGKIRLHHRETHARYLIGSGKAQELAERVKAEKLDVIIFDNELTPSQQRNWEQLTGITVIDRQEVIIDIFAKRAQTREARLQIDLARL